MESTAVPSDDEYDIISEPGSRASLDSSIEDSFHSAFEVRELLPSTDAQDRFETTRWSSREIQQYIQRSLTPSMISVVSNKRRLRVYVDGSFDNFDVGHALKLRQAKLGFHSVHLLVGVFSDDVLQQKDCLPNRPEVERAELIRHCRWVDEVINNAPWQLTLDFLKDRAIDFVAVDEGTSIDPAFHKDRVKAYDELQKHGKVIKTRKTFALSSQQKLAVQTPSQRATPTLTSTRSLPDPNTFDDIDISQDVSVQK